MKDDIYPDPINRDPFWMIALAWIFKRTGLL